IGLASCPMDKDILICLQALEWIRLEPHLPSDVCERLTEDDRGMPMLEGRIVPDDATYREFDSAEEPPFFISDREECFRFKYEGCERQIFVNFGPNSRK